MKKKKASSKLESGDDIDPKIYNLGALHVLLDMASRSECEAYAREELG